MPREPAERQPRRRLRDLKQPVSLRLTPEAQRLADELAERLGVSRTAIVEMALRGWVPQELARLAKAQPVPAAQPPKEGQQ